MARGPLSLEHLEWLIESRTKNQKACLRLLRLFEAYGSSLKTKKFAPAAQALLSIAFSLWRAAFLADKTGRRADVFAHGREFLIRLVEDNAISYAQDKNALEWTFNYYTRNAKNELIDLSMRWDMLPPYEALSRSPKERWEYCQTLLETYIVIFEEHLLHLETMREETKNKRARRKQKKKNRATVRALTLSNR